MSEDTTPPEIDMDGEDGNANIDRLLAENQALKEQMLRYAADAENTKRRAEREANDARAYAIQKFGKDLLAAADYLAMANAHAPADHADPVVKNFVVGVQMTEKELQAAFERNGLKKIAPKPGDKFDPHLHQAMSEQPAEGDVAPGAFNRQLHFCPGSPIVRARRITRESARPEWRGLATLAESKPWGRPPRPNPQQNAS